MTSFNVTYRNFLRFFLVQIHLRSDEQAVVATNGAVYYAPSQPAPLNNIPIDQFSAAAAGVYPQAAVPAIYPQTIPYQPYYQYYSVPMVSSCISSYHTIRIVNLIASQINDITNPVKCAHFQNVPAIWPQSYQGMYTLNIRK